MQLNWLRKLGSTDITVSALGLGTVKFGRNTAVKYPTTFTLPTPKEIVTLLSLAQDLGINTIDTAPAYGNSEEILGKLLPGKREDWIIVSKAGENFNDGQSHYDFSAAAVDQSITNSLKKLRTSYLDILLLHSNGDDVAIMHQEQLLSILTKRKQAGDIRAFGISSKTVAGGLLGLELTDLVMVTYNPSNQAEREVLDQAQLINKAVLIKKAFNSGYLLNNTKSVDLSEIFANIFAHPAVTNTIVGTLNPQHLRDNVAAVQEALAG